MKKTLILVQFILAVNLLAQQIETCGTVESTDEEMAQKPWYYDNNYLDIIENAKDKFLNNSLQRKVKFNPGLIINPISIPIRFWIYEDAANNTRLPDDEELQKLWILRKFLHPMDEIDSMEFLLDKLTGTKTNDEFFDSMKRS